MTKPKINRYALKKARALAIQALYQWHFTKDALSKIKQDFATQINPKKVDSAYFEELITGTIEKQEELDEIIKKTLDRKITELNPVELAILRYATYELKFCLQVPYKVVINEALELTKTFGATDSFKYINGVLDKIAASLRSSEK